MRSLEWKQLIGKFLHGSICLWWWWTSHQSSAHKGVRLFRFYGRWSVDRRLRWFLMFLRTRECTRVVNKSKSVRAPPSLCLSCFVDCTQQASLGHSDHLLLLSRLALLLSLFSLLPRSDIDSFLVFTSSHSVLTLWLLVALLSFLSFGSWCPLM